MGCLFQASPSTWSRNWEVWSSSSNDGSIVGPYTSTTFWRRSGKNKPFGREFGRCVDASRKLLKDCVFCLPLSFFCLYCIYIVSYMYTTLQWHFSERRNCWKHAAVLKMDLLLKMRNFDVDVRDTVVFSTNRILGFQRHSAPWEKICVCGISLVLKGFCLNMTFTWHMT